jgi:hypothetical protein
LALTGLDLFGFARVELGAQLFLNAANFAQYLAGFDCDILAPWEFWPNHSKENRLAFCLQPNYLRLDRHWFQP